MFGVLELVVADVVHPRWANAAGQRPFHRRVASKQTLVTTPARPIRLLVLSRKKSTHRHAEHVTEGSLGALLLRIVEEVKTGSRGIPNVDLARLNLRVGKPLSRLAATLPDEPALVDAARKAADEILAGK